MTKEELIERIAPELPQFLRNGNIRAFLGSDPTLSVTDIQRLLRIHFVLTRSSELEVGIVDFVELLHQEMRSIKACIEPQGVLRKEEITGRIDWGMTQKARSRFDERRNDLFVCDENEKDYDLAENIVLKHLLRIILEIVEEEIIFAQDKRYPWAEVWFQKDDLLSVLRDVFHKNIYLQRINDEDVPISDRMLSKASRSRKSLYKNAALLLIRYRALMSFQFNQEEAKCLLKNTFIEPESEDLLFELYWTIEIAKLFPARRYNIIRPGSDVFAEWVSEGQTITLYHDSCGGFEFGGIMSGLEGLLIEQDNFLGRDLKSIEKYCEMTNKRGISWNGRPDIIVIKKGPLGDMKGVIICEVKYTSNVEYALHGLRELLDYLAHMKGQGKYFIEHDDLFEGLKNIHGVLFVADAPPEFIDMTEDNIRIFRFGNDLKEIAEMIR